MLLHPPNQRYKRLKIKNGQNDRSGNSSVKVFDLFLVEKCNICAIVYGAKSKAAKHDGVSHFCLLYNSVSQTFSTRVPLKDFVLCLRTTNIWIIE